MRFCRVDLSAFSSYSFYMDTVDRKRKKVVPPTPEEEAMAAYEDIISVFSSTTDPGEMKALFDDMFTESEKKDFVTRWLLMDDIYKGKPQREIAAKRGLSLCKITRGSKMLKKEDGFMRHLLSSRYDEDHTHI